LRLLAAIFEKGPYLMRMMGKTAAKKTDKLAVQQEAKAEKKKDRQLARQNKKSRGGSGNRKRVSIGLKLGLAICACVLVVAGVLGVISMLALSESTRNALGKNMEDAAIISANVVSEKLNDLISDMEYISADVNKIASKELKRVKIDLILEEEGFEALGMADETGLLAGKGETTNVSGEEFFIRCKETGKPFISDITVSNGKALVTVAVPYFENETFMGVMFSVQRAEFLSDVISTLRMGESGSAYIVDSYGNIVAHDNISLVRSQYNPIIAAETDRSMAQFADMIQKALQGDYSAKFFNNNDTDLVTASAKISGTKDWVLFLSADSNEYTSILRTSIVIVSGATAALLVFAFIIASIIANSLAKPIRKLEEAARQMADGDLSVNISSKGRDEVAQLAQSMRNMQANLLLYVSEIRRCLSALAKGDLTVSVETEFKGDFNEIRDSIETIINSLNESISEVKVAAEQIAASSEQVASGAQTLASGTAEQASTIEEISAMIQEIESEATKTAENTVMAEKKTREAVEEIEACNRDMSSLSDAMDEISRATNDISKIIKTIEDIAFQTNILALNAAVEAARAGEAGKGFAVVADEVRNLASKSAEAAKNTTLLIDSTVNAVLNGTTITDKTATSLGKVVANVKEMDEIIREIAVAAEGQARSVEQVNSGVEQISAVVQTNSATSEQSAASIEEMMTYAQNLKKLTEYFKIRS